MATPQEIGTALRLATSPIKTTGGIKSGLQGGAASDLRAGSAALSTFETFAGAIPKFLPVVGGIPVVGALALAASIGADNIDVQRETNKSGQLSDATWCKLAADVVGVLGMVAAGTAAAAGATVSAPVVAAVCLGGAALGLLGLLSDPNGHAVSDAMDQLLAGIQDLLAANGLEGDPFGACDLLPSDSIDGIKSQFDLAKVVLPPINCSPLILDLDGDGIETIGAKDGAYFDHAKDGFAEQTGWVGQDDGLLVLDRNHNGLIDDGTELFGNNTVLANGTTAANGFAALAELDTNLDGKINNQDAAFADLKIWKDVNGDGYTEAGELLSLAEAGVQSINTGSTTSTLVDADGNAHKQIGTFTRTDGTTAAVEDVWFAVDETHSIATEWFDVPDDIAALPDAKGYGKVYDLHQAMVRDQSGELQELVSRFSSALTAVERNALVDQIIFK